MTARVEPPAEHWDKRWHWLAWGDGPLPAKWCAPNVWGEPWLWVLHGGRVLTPAEAAAAGYRWENVAVPPDLRDAE